MESEPSQSQEACCLETTCDLQCNDATFDVQQSFEEPSNDQETNELDEVVIDGETFYLVPKYSAKYVPSSSVTETSLEGIGQVEVGSQFMYIPVKLVWQLQTTISLHTNLQIEVSCCREYLSSKYGKSDKMPPFDPDSLQEACIVTSANKLSHVILNAMSYEARSEKRQEHNKEKVVTIIYMLMYSRSQKA